MFDLVRLQQELIKAMKDLDNWKMKGTDTPYLTYHEQLDIFKEHLELLKQKIKLEKNNERL